MKHHVVPRADRAVAVVVIRTMRGSPLLWIAVCLVVLLGQLKMVQATVLPEERADLLYHSYEGGGMMTSHQTR